MPSSNTTPTTTPTGVGAFKTHETQSLEAFATTKRQLVARGCTPEEAAHALSLLLGMGVPPAQLGQWVDDLWNMVETALDGVFGE